MKIKRTLLIQIILLILVFIIGALYFLKVPIGSFLQGYLNFPKPIYDSCVLTDQNGVIEKIDCNNFDEERTKLVDGKYVAKVVYVNKSLGNNGESIIPFNIQGGESTCAFIEEGYQPVITVSTGETGIASERTIKEATVLEAGSQNQLLLINYLKNGQTSAFDQFICGNGLVGIVTDSENKELGKVQLNFNGFINTTKNVNELRIIPGSFYYNQNKVSDLKPGSYYLQINIYPDLKFRFEIPCSTNFPEVSIDNIVTNKPKSGITLDLTKLDPKWATLCQDKLYFGYQNSTVSGDQFTLPAKLTLAQAAVAATKTTPAQKATPTTISFNLTDFPALQKPDITYPYTGTISLFFRDRSDSKDVYTLCSTKLTVDPKALTPSPSPVALKTPTPAPISAPTTPIKVRVKRDPTSTTGTTTQPTNSPL